MPSLSSWLKKFGFCLESLRAHPLFQFLPPPPNKSIRLELQTTYLSYTWSPVSPLPTKLETYKQCFRILSKSGKPTLPLYLRAHVSFDLRMIMGHLQIRSHRLKIETDRWLRPKPPKESRIRRLCNRDVETEEHFVFYCPAYEDIR